ncbi:hypothetical protein [Actinomadura alba]|uniref:Uncharacterized protein n=1 Tax=Actinomadura alba TaxID=406431 RepID=A0ABR7M0L3_9ACTN|nr:hypothetical protein [Actinomadura alba]MBC6470262.1 hypothetical protein [Actinomadura alba]
MTTDAPAETGAPDVRSLLAKYREVVVPAAVNFLGERTSANELRELWRPYYNGEFYNYDLTVERSWRQASGSDGRLESGTPEADPKHEVPLKHFPVSTAHNNMDRLIEVLAIELGDQTIAKTEIRERKVDLAHIVDRLDALMASLVE